MKTKNILSASLSLMLAVFFASCSTSVDIAKRQYNNGYYVHFASKKNVSSVPSETITASKVIKPVMATEVVAEPVSKTADVSEEKKVVSEQTLASTGNKSTVSSLRKHLKDAMVERENFSSESSSTERAKFNYAQKRFDPLEFPGSMSRDTPGIILILLCIFLPFVAVGIVDDWGTKFLIDVILCLLFWIPGIIYAFIVCFG